MCISRKCLLVQSRDSSFFVCPSVGCEWITTFYSLKKLNLITSTFDICWLFDFIVFGTVECLFQPQKAHTRFQLLVSCRHSMGRPSHGSEPAESVGQDIDFWKRISTEIFVSLLRKYAKFNGSLVNKTFLSRPRPRPCISRPRLAFFIETKTKTF